MNAEEIAKRILAGEDVPQQHRDILADAFLTCVTRFEKLAHQSSGDPLSTTKSDAMAAWAQMTLREIREVP